MAAPRVRLAGALLALACLAPGAARGQAPAQVDSLAQAYRVDYAVPDVPALTLVDGDAGDLVRPTTVRELAVALSGFTGDGGLSLPRAAAVEFSPGMLFFGRRLTLSRYQRSAALYRLRISVATRRREEDGPQTALAVAVRTSFIDGADLRTSPAFLAAAGRIVAQVAAIDAAAEDAAEAGGIDAPVVYTAEQRAALERLTAEYRALPELVADTAWNKRVFDAAFGVVAVGDSAGNDLEVRQVAGWLSYGGGIGTWGQVVVGARMASDRDSTSGKFAMAGSAVARLYGGTNHQKVYLDLQLSKRGDADAAAVLSGGSELRVARGLWATLAVGAEWDGAGRDGRLRARFAFKSAFPM